MDRGTEGTTFNSDMDMGIGTDMDATAKPKMERETMTDTNGNTMYRFGSVYFAIFGLIVLGIGGAELLLGVTGRSAEWGILELSGEFLLWRGLILFFAGGFYLSSVTRFAEIHNQAKAVMASVMIWLVGGMQILGMILGSIPGGEAGGWFNTLDGFLTSYSAPYTPAVILLPFSLVILSFIRVQSRRERDLDLEPAFGTTNDNTSTSTNANANTNTHTKTDAPAPSIGGQSVIRKIVNETDANMDAPSPSIEGWSL